MRFLQGVDGNLPKRPILITFDDGRLDSYRGADKILAEHGFRATMFAIAGFVEEDSPFYLTWDELRAMATSGRWDVQEHAGVGHVNVRYDAAGHEGPAYAYRQYTPGEGLETFARVQDARPPRHPVGEAHDDRAAARLHPLSFAVPFGSYGQDRHERRRASRGFMSRLLRRHFQAVFMTEPPVYTTPLEHRARALAADRAPRGHRHGHALPLAARPDSRAARAARAADQGAGGAQRRRAGPASG